MWCLRSSRGQFERAHPSEPGTDLDELARSLGAPRAEGPRGNSQVLDELMGSVRLSNSRGRRSDGVFCGITSDSITAETQALRKGAWIALGSRFVALTEATAALSLAFPRLLDQAHILRNQCGEAESLRFLGNARASAFAYLGATLGINNLGDTDSDLWDRFRDTTECAALVRSALLFTICHELAHLTQGDQTSRVDKQLRETRMALARKLPPELWPSNLPHRDELTADRTALEVATGATHDAAALEWLMPGSIIATTAIAVDGWFMDQSAISDTHPAPFFRVECLPLYWCDYLDAASASNWPDDNSPREQAFAQFAEAWTLSRWIAGLYREGRSGLQAVADLQETWGYVVAAADRQGVILPSMAISEIGPEAPWRDV